MHDGDCECDCCNGVNAASFEQGYIGSARVAAVVDLHARLTSVIDAAEGWRRRQENGVSLGPILDEHIEQLTEMCTELEGYCCLGSDCATMAAL